MKNYLLLNYLYYLYLLIYLTKCFNYDNNNLINNNNELIIKEILEYYHCGQGNL